MKKTFSDIDDYIGSQRVEVRAILEKIRQAIQEAAPNAQEGISYGMPAFRENGNLVYFAVFNKHIGFYALPSGNAAFQKELALYKTGKGSIQFPLDKPVPYKLITKIVNFRVLENSKKQQLKS